MKIISKISMIALVAAMAMSMTSCLKDKKYDDRTTQAIHPDGAQKIIEIGLSTTSNSKYLGLSFDPITHDTTIRLIPVTLASVNAASEDIHVHLVKNDALVTDYNTLNGTDFVIPNSSLYTIINPNNEVIIPKGSNTGYLQIKFTPLALLGSNYALGFAIASVDQPGYIISGNEQNGVVSLVVKNKYDGRYKVTGTCVDANGLYRGVYPKEVDLITVSGTTVIYYDHTNDYINYLVANIATGGLANTGIRPQFTFNTTTDQVSGIVNVTSGAAMSFVSGAASSFNNANHSFKVDWTSGRWHVTESYAYEGPRD